MRRRREIFFGFGANIRMAPKIRMAPLLLPDLEKGAILSLNTPDLNHHKIVTNELLSQFLASISQTVLL